jgi:hypothetical protein
VSSVRYELGFYIPEDGILHGHLKSYIALTGSALQRRRNVSPVRYELGFYILLNKSASHAALPMAISKFSSNAAR